MVSKQLAALTKKGAVFDANISIPSLPILDKKKKKDKTAAKKPNVPVAKQLQHVPPSAPVPPAKRLAVPPPK